MVQNHRRGTRRSGATVVEFAFVALIFFLFVFGIVEWGRFVLMRHLIDTAAREGARYAVVNANDTTVTPDTLALVNQKMSGFNTTLPNYNAQCYKATISGSTITNAGAANTANFGDLIAVQIDADFNPVLPTFIFFGKVPHMKSISAMKSEAN